MRAQRFLEKCTEYIASRFLLFSVLAYALGSITNVRNFLKSQDEPFAFVRFKMVQYHIDYLEHGFLKRGVIGTAIQPFIQQFDVGSAASHKFVVVFYSTFGLLLIVVCAKAISHVESSLPSQGHFTFSVLKSILAIGSFGFAQIALDLGRLDLFGYLVLLMSIIVLLRKRFVLASFLAVLGVLTHEAYLVYGVPIMAALMLSLSLDRSVVLRISEFQPLLRSASFYSFAPLILGSVAAGLLVYIYGNTLPTSLKNIGTGARAWDRGLLEPSIGHSPIETFVLISVLTIMYVWWIAFYRKNKRSFDLIFLASLCPLSLFFFGQDHARWASVIFIVLFVCVCINVARFGFSFRDVDWGTSWPLLLLALPLGPIGITKIYPYVQDAWRILGETMS